MKARLRKYYRYAYRGKLLPSRESMGLPDGTQKAEEIQGLNVPV